VLGTRVKQTPRELVLNSEESAEVFCTHNDNNLLYMNWYRQLSRRAIELIVGIASDGEPNFEPGFDKGRYDIAYTRRDDFKDVKGQSLQKVSQWPSQSVVTLGSTVELQCSQSSSGQNMYWYRQQRSTGLQLIMLSVYMSEPERGEKISDRFSSTRPKMEIISLTISQAEESDTDVSALFSEGKMGRIMLLLLCGYLFSIRFGWSAEVHQTPLQLISNPGAVLSVSCSHNDNNLEYMYWYRQQLGKGLEQIAYFFTNSDAEFEEDFKKNKERFEIRKPSALSGSFVLKTLAEEDSAVYFCAARSSGAITVQQFPGSLFGSLSDDAQITCQHDDSSYQYMYWYQQVKGQQALELVGFLTYTDVTQDEKYKGKFNLTGDGRKRGSLLITRLSADDRGTYFCAANVKGQTRQKVSQWPSQSVVTLGSTVELQCSQSSSDQNMYWYRQQRSTGLQLIMLSVYMSEPERGEKISDRFSSTRPKMEIISLTISQAEESDTGKMGRIMLLLLCGYLFSIRSGWSAEVHQTPLQLISNPGAVLSVSCSHDDSTLNTMYWYRQQLGKGLELIAYIYTNSEAEFEEDFKKNKERFEIRKPSALSGSFVLKTLAEEDSAVYFCAARAESQSAVEVTQSPSVLTLKQGETAAISCSQTSSNTYMYWYQQKSNGPLQFIFSTANSDEVTEKGDGVPDRFKVSRKSLMKTELIISRVQPEDSAVFYCAASPQQ
ncbi:hypothetical protein GJAV_G00252460, partial [Gymnothorax javanicus]